MTKAEKQGRISLEAAEKRSGSDHQEVIIGDRARCAVCGWVDEGQPDRSYHPEAYFS